VNFQRSVIIAALWRLKVARSENFVSNFCVFWKTTLYGKIYKILFRKLSLFHRSTLLCWNVNFFRREIGEIVRYLPDKKQQNFGSFSNCRCCSDRATNLPGPSPKFGSHCSRFHPNRFSFGGIIAERVKAVLSPHRVFSMIVFSSL